MTSALWIACVTVMLNDVTQPWDGHFSFSLFSFVCLKNVRKLILLLALKRVFPGDCTAVKLHKTIQRAFPCDKQQKKKRDVAQCSLVYSTAVDTCWNAKERESSKYFENNCFKEWLTWAVECVSEINTDPVK